MESPATEKQKPSHRLGSLNSGARTRTNAAGVEQRACRAGPEGVSRCAANNRTEFDEESGCRKAKTQP
ncbi:hypothetical protein FMJ60_14135 [Klebsiella quasipneumoniae]|nr:hypothetical protein [Klebsiella quasipneumoniae]MBZ7054870.1 hypothetical protein [Klebsiella quasipneumoniae]